LGLSSAPLTSAELPTSAAAAKKSMNTAARLLNNMEDLHLFWREAPTNFPPLTLPRLSPDRMQRPLRWVATRAWRVSIGTPRCSWRPTIAPG
jgi:hypothetical protein